MFKANRLLAIIVLFFFVVSMGSCGGGGGGGSGGTGGGTQGLTPSDLGWVIPQTNPENVTTLPTGEEISSELISITVKDNVSRETVEGIVNGIGGSIAGYIPPDEDFDTYWYWIKFSPPKTGLEVRQIVDQLQVNPNIETASAVFMQEIYGNVFRDFHL
jgi:hypothetical protein